jgi:ABC-type multidrug transport system fused ATPase/permease subunit
MKEQFAQIEIEIDENNNNNKDIKQELLESLEERDKKALLFYKSALVYMEDYQNAKKLSIVFVIVLMLFIGFIFSKFLMLSMFAMASFLISVFMFYEKIVATIFKIISEINSSYKENNLLMRKMTKTFSEQTYKSISFNSKTQNLKKSINKTYWEKLSKEEIGTELYKIYLENVIDNIDTLHDLAELKTLRSENIIKENEKEIIVNEKSI